MKANDYQELTARTLIDEPDFEIEASDLALIWDCINLAAFIGAMCDAVKKGVLHQHGFSRLDFFTSIKGLKELIKDIEDRKSSDFVPKFDVMMAWNTLGS